jgi:spore coat protein U-like protein
MLSVYVKPAIRVAAVAAMLAGVHGRQARGATPIASTTLQVAASVNLSCSIAASPLPFGNYDGTGDVDADGALALNCTNNGNNVRVRLGQGLYPAAGSTDSNPLRQMGSGANRLRYDLYFDAARTDVWGNNNPGRRPTTPYPTIMPVYGRIPGAQAPPPGAYSDTVVALVNF